VEILNLVPNLDTGVGAASAPRFEKEAGDLGRRTTPPPGGPDRAFYWQRLIDEGIVKSGSEIARGLGKKTVHGTAGGV
jgi:hypothetical protein